MALVVGRQIIHFKAKCNRKRREQHQVNNSFSLSLCIFVSLCLSLCLSRSVSLSPCLSLALSLSLCTLACVRVFARAAASWASDRFRVQAKFALQLGPFIQLIPFHALELSLQEGLTFRRAFGPNFL